MKSALLRALILSAIMAPTSVMAETGPWVDVAPGAKIRLLTSDYVDPNGKMLAGLEFQLRDGMKTYWRIPGESGIPLTANWSNSQNIDQVNFLWPMPKRAISLGYFDYVYDQDFVLPFEVEISAESDKNVALLNGNLLMGICGEICVPVTYNIAQSLPLDQKDISVSFTLEAAKAYVPINDDRANAPFDAVYFDQSENKIWVKPSSDAEENQTLILDLPNQNLLFDVPQNRPGSSLLSFEPLKEISLVDHVGMSARLTYSGREGAFEKQVPILLFDALDQ